MENKVGRLVRFLQQHNQVKRGTIGIVLGIQAQKSYSKPIYEVFFSNGVCLNLVALGVSFEFID